MTDDEPCYGPDELADLAGVSRRTVRYYVQRGLLPAPAGLGRGKHYSKAHLARLIRIRELQAGGIPLEEIADRLDGREPAPPAPVERPTQSMWTRVEIADGVELNLRGRRLTQQQLSTLIEQIQQTIGVES